MLFLLYYWWLNNPGVSVGNGLPNEDINWSGPLSELYTGKNVRINVMSDGALLNHVSYKDRAIKDQFLNIFTEELQIETENPSKNFIATASLGLASGKRTPDGNFTGIAPDSKVGSFYFSNSSGYHDHPQSVVCYRSHEWDISILQYQMTDCEGRFCRYIEPEVLPKEILNDCLYQPLEETWAHPIIVPVGVDSTSDPLFTPPARWPMVFAISGVNNRGVPLNHVSEGVGVFLACPCADNAALPSASPISETAELKNFTSPNASAAIFAGALAVIMEANPNLTLADLFYVTALTADKTMPDSLNWDVNAFGLNFNRRTGFGRLNLGRAVELALNYESCGNFSEWEETKPINLLLKKGDYNITFDVTDEDVKSAISVMIKITARKLSFGSLNPHLISPGGTVCEMKILTEGDLQLDIRSMEFSSYKFLGEDPRGVWTLIFKETDDANRGTITSVGLHIYYTKKQPKRDQINQRLGANPFAPGPDVIEFPNAVEPVEFIGGTSWTIDVVVPERYRDAPYLSYIQDQSGKRRVKVKAYYNKDFTQMSLSYVPTVFKNGLNISFVIDSVDPENGYTSSVLLNYTNPYKPGIISPKNGSSLLISDRDLSVQYALDLDYISDDGYSTSAALTILSANSKTILDRTWMRNLGKETYRNAVPSDKSFLFQISPSSSDRYEKFDPMTVLLFVKAAPGDFAPTKSGFGWFNLIVIFALLVVAFILLIIRSIALSRQKAIHVDEDQTLIEMANTA